MRTFPRERGATRRREPALHVSRQLRNRCRCGRHVDSAQVEAKLYPNHLQRTCGQRALDDIVHDRGRQGKEFMTAGCCVAAIAVNSGTSQKHSQGLLRPRSRSRRCKSLCSFSEAVLHLLLRSTRTPKPGKAFYTMKRILTACHLVIPRRRPARCVLPRCLGGSWWLTSDVVVISSPPLGSGGALANPRSFAYIRRCLHRSPPLGVLTPHVDHARATTYPLGDIRRRSSLSHRMPARARRST